MITPSIPGIRRHYRPLEDSAITHLTPHRASRITGRTAESINRRKYRIGNPDLDHHRHVTKDDYQNATKNKATNNRQPWQQWEDDYLLSNASLETLRDKALYLGRTYRAVESRRRDLLRQLDAN